jgi:serine O-acetyltransferase
MLLRLHSIARWCYLHHVPFVPRLIKTFLYVVFNCILPAETSVGAGTCFHHHGWCVLVHPNVEIGEGCNIYNQVVIGGGHDGPDGPPIRIIIGNRVNIGTGAKVLCKSGTLTIGDGSTIAANAVVLSDVPPNSLAVGIPADSVPKKRSRPAA